MLAHNSLIMLGNCGIGRVTEPECQRVGPQGELIELLDYVGDKVNFRLAALGHARRPRGLRHGPKQRNSRQEQDYECSGLQDHAVLRTALVHLLLLNGSSRCVPSS